MSGAFLSVDLETFIDEYLKKANEEVDCYNRSIKDFDARDLFE